MRRSGLSSRQAWWEPRSTFWRLFLISIAQRRSGHGHNEVDLGAGRDAIEIGLDFIKRGQTKQTVEEAGIANIDAGRFRQLARIAVRGLELMLHQKRIDHKVEIGPDLLAVDTGARASAAALRSSE